MQTYFYAMSVLKLLTKNITSFTTSRDLEDFLEGILTPLELEQIGIRLKIIKMLKKGVPQHKIAADLEIGVATVTRGSRMLKEGKFNYPIWA